MEFETERARSYYRESAPLLNLIAAQSRPSLWALDCDLFEVAGSCGGIALRCAGAADLAFERGEDLDRSARRQRADSGPVAFQRLVEPCKFSHAQCLGAPGNLRS